MSGSIGRMLLSALFLGIAQVAAAQSPPAPAAAPVPPNQLLKAEELDQLLAPVALYSDNLLAEVLMASTYPLEVVQADRWLQANKSLKGDQLKAAVEKQNWEASIKTLTAVPAVLSMMSTKLDWTQKLGDAVLAQQTDVMDAVQRLRAKAQVNNQLKTTKEQKVSVKQEQNKQVIVIEPAVPNTIYVPYYNPAVVYGAWPYAAYPPYYFYPPGYAAGAALATGMAFATGVAIGAWAAGGRYWGGGVNWGGNNIVVNRSINVSNTNLTNWNHDAQHRHGVRYNNANVAQKFAGRTPAGNAQNRLDFRGHDGKPALNPGGDRPNIGDRGGRDRPGAGGSGTRDRPNIGDRGSSREAVGSRGGGERHPPSRGGGGRDHAFGNIGGGGGNARAEAVRGHASLGGGGGGIRSGGGGGFRGGGGGGGGRGGRRSDVQVKHDIMLLGRLDNGLGFYRFVYNGGDKAYVGVMAQEVQAIAPHAVARGGDGYLRVRYDRLGLRFESYDRWISSGARIPSAAADGVAK